MKRLGEFALVLLVFVSLCADIEYARAATVTKLYSVSSVDDQLREVDPATGSTLSSVAITLAGKTVSRSTGLATDPTTGQLWALLRTSDSGTCTGNPDSGGGGRIPWLVKLDPITGVATLVGSTGDCFAGIAFKSDGTLYGVTGDGANVSETLYTLSKTTGAATLVTPLGNGDSGEAIAINPNDGLLYHASGFVTPIFEKVNLTTLGITDIPLSGFQYSELAALTMRQDGVFLAADIDSNLLTVTTDGVVAVSGLLDQTPKGLAFVTITTSNLSVTCPGQSLQSAINSAVPGDTVTVSGTCSENILVRNEKQRITIDGAGAGAGTKATINGTAGSPTVNVRGKGILLQNFTITGGSNGIYVNRGSNAVINNNTIQNSNGNGVVVDELAFSVITNNTIQNNPEAGVVVSENSAARIGFNLDSESSASANTIQNNAGRGITVDNGSSARIIGNTISGNGQEGVVVERDSSADIASNAINSNQSDGVIVESDSSVMLGEDSGTTIYELSNSTSVSNTGFGISCDDGSAVGGRQGSLTGASGASSFASSCVNGLLP